MMEEGLNSEGYKKTISATRYNALRRNNQEGRLQAEREAVPKISGRAEQPGGAESENQVSAMRIHERSIAIINS